MFHIASKLGLLGLAMLVIPATPLALGAQETSSVISSEIAISRERAEIKLELADGRVVTLATVIGARGAPAANRLQRNVSGNSEVLALSVERGDAVDRSWRELLNSAIEADAESLGTLLREWQAPSSEGASLDSALEAALSGEPLAASTAVAGSSTLDDSVSKLQSKISELEAMLEHAQINAQSARQRHGPDWFSPLRHIGRGISGVLSVILTLAVLFGIGFVVVLLGGRKYIEGVADTARSSISRSFLVGLAGTFLLIPVYILGIIALAVSIVGIPALIVWIPLFPVGVMAAALLGYLGIAHAAGESFSERRYYGGQWFTRANSYYYMLTGLGLLLALFIAANVVTMAGPWLGFINAILNFFGVVLTWAAMTTGFGAVLISRGGSRLATTSSPAETVYTEETGV